MRVFHKNLFALSLILSSAAFAQNQPPLMPARFADDAEASSGERQRESAPVRLGLQVGAVAFARPSQLFSPLDTYVGARFFSRFVLLDRIYIIPSIGFYSLANGVQIGSGAPHLLDLGAQVHLALLKIGPVAILAGLNQRLGVEFWADASGVRGNWAYRLGPGANVNIRFSRSLSALVGLDLTFPLNQVLTPQWTGHAGLLIGF